jgi:hypothetical protein
VLRYAVCALVAAAIATADAADAPPLRIPFVVGLTTVRATSEARGDYENLRVVDAITPAGYRITASGEVPADDGSGLREVSIVRRVRAEDQRDARILRTYFHTGDAEQFSNTVPGLSAAMLNDLRKTGRARLTWLDVGVLFGMTAVRRELSGTIARVDGGPTTLSMLVNGHSVRLPVIHAKGLLSDAAGTEEVEFHALDDPDNPILLRSRVPGFTSAVIKIDYPLATPGRADSSIESELAARRPAEIYGIYFSFGRADIRPQSERVLDEIAGVLAQHPDWTLRIVGHTDGIGSDVANLDLSKRRAASVKAALVNHHGIDAKRLVTDGFGESQPKDRNDTPEGRALNRRVELTRL